MQYFPVLTRHVCIFYFDFCVIRNEFSLSHHEHRSSNAVPIYWFNAKGTQSQKPARTKTHKHRMIVAVTCNRIEVEHNKLKRILYCCCFCCYYCYYPLRLFQLCTVYTHSVRYVTHRYFQRTHSPRSSIPRIQPRTTKNFPFEFCSWYEKRLNVECVQVRDKWNGSESSKRTEWVQWKRMMSDGIESKSRRINETLLIGNSVSVQWTAQPKLTLFFTIRPLPFDPLQMKFKVRSTCTRIISMGNI